MREGEGERERTERQGGGEGKEARPCPHFPKRKLTSVLYVWYESRGRRVMRYTSSRPGGPAPFLGFILSAGGRPRQLMCL